MNDNSDDGDRRNAKIQQSKVEQSREEEEDDDDDDDDGENGEHQGSKRSRKRKKKNTYRDTNKKEMRPIFALCLLVFVFREHKEKERQKSIRHTSMTMITCNSSFPLAITR